MVTLNFQDKWKTVVGLEFIQRLFLLPALVISLAFLAASVSAKSISPPDIRVLIDISGSMKKNDPENLRIPAVNLLTELLPTGSTAGVWTFGQYVNMLVPIGKVDKKWRKLAKKEAKKINSVALYTNIGGALDKASDDFTGTKRFDNTHFILLTDGMVDISKNPEVNRKERERILTTVLNKIKSRGATISTIALSDNADKSLMDKLAIATGGSSSVAKTPEALSRIFMQVLNQSVPAQQVPLKDNKFDVDSSIEEFTALIYRKPGSKETRVISPDKKVETYKKHSKDIKWYRDKGYDLITVTRPLEGEWQLEAQLLPDSRVTIVSNLKLHVNPLPLNFYAGDILNVSASLEENGKVITQPDFLSLLNVKLNVRTEDNKSGTKIISNPDNPPKNGIFSSTISKLRAVGKYQVNVLVDGKTFKRENQQFITLRSPLDVEVSGSGTGESSKYRVVITPLSTDINLEKSSLLTKIYAPDGTNLIKIVPFNKKTQQWILSVNAFKGNGTYKIALKVNGVNKQGDKFSFIPNVFNALFPRNVASSSQVVSLKASKPIKKPKAKPVKTKIKKTIKPVSIAQPIVIPKKIEQPVSKKKLPEKKTKGLSKTMFWVIVGSATVLLLLLVSGFVFWILKKKKIKVKENGEEDKEELTAVPVEKGPEPEAALVEDPTPEIDVVPDDELDFAKDEVEAEELDTNVEDIEQLVAEAEAEAETDPVAEIKPEPEQEEDDLDEFNLEDFDISEADDLPDITEEEPKK